MFKHQDDQSGFSDGVARSLLVLVQVVAVPLCSLVFGWLALLAVEFLVGQFWKTFRDDGIAYVVYGALGFLAGYTLQRLFPRLVSSGARWAWTLPLLVLGWAVVEDLRLGLLGEIRDIFAPGLRPEAGWVFILVTMPTIGSLFYSIGVFIAGRRQLPPRNALSSSVA